jgi:hypothetical protein
MWAWLRAIALTGILLCPAAAKAHWFRARRAAYRSYYYPVPVYRSFYYYPVYSVPVSSVPVYSVPVWVPPPVVRMESPLAVPTAAPPSGSPIIPRRPLPSTKEPPRIRESSSSKRSSSYYETSEDGQSGRVTVGFFNRSQRDLRLNINGRTRRLAPGESLKLRLPRKFVWQRVGSDPQVERVPADKSTLDLVFRR